MRSKQSSFWGGLIGAQSGSTARQTENLVSTSADPIGLATLNIGIPSAQSLTVGSLPEVRSWLYDHRTRPARCCSESLPLLAVKIFRLHRRDTHIIDPPPVAVYLFPT